MKLLTLVTGLLGLLSTPALASHSAKDERPNTSRVTLPATFKPLPAFKNANLVHIISLEKNYVKESINVLIENVATRHHNEYFVPFTAEQMARVGAFEVKDRKNANAGPFTVHAVDFDPQRLV
jgi:oligosaccharyltransferase complex subunit alpha (ribophorin I)